MSARVERLGFLGACGTSAAISVTVIWRLAFRMDGLLTFNLFDDAMISMRYAHNLAAGEGLVWNPGGERVEGITNPLWTLWMAVLHLVPVHPTKVSLLVMLSGALLVLGILWVVRTLIRQLAPGDTVASLVGVGLTATFYPLVYWSLGGMEVGLLAFLAGIMVLSAVRLGPGGGASATGAEHDQRRARMFLAVAASAAVLTRLDAVVAVVVVLAFVAWRTPAAQRPRVMAVLAAPPAAALVLTTAARALYYDDWLPNTYYLKATGSPLTERLDAGVHTLYLVVLAQLALLLVAAVYGLRGVGHEPAASVAETRLPLGVAPELGLLGALVLSQMAYSVWVGGDAWELFLIANRYLTTAVVPLMVLAGIGVARASREARSRWVFGLLVAAVLVARLPLLRRDHVPYFVSRVSETVTASVVVALVALVIAVAVVVLLPRRGRSPGPLLAAVFATLMVVQLNMHNVIAWWELDGGLSEEHASRQGWAIRQATSPDTLLAVWLAGSEVYFADRQAVDLYGKSDRHIARLPAEGTRFWPGHMKKDLAWSLRTYRPDLVQVSDFWPISPTDSEILKAHDYERLRAGDLWMRTGTDAFDPAELRDEVKRFLNT